MAESEDNTPSGDPEIDRNVADLDHKDGKLEEAIRDTQREWEAKQGDQSVPGAVPEDQFDDEESAREDDSEAEATDRAGQ